MSKCPPCHLAHCTASIKLRMEMKNELFSHHNKLSLLFHPTPYFTCNSHLVPLSFSSDLCFHDGSLLAYQLSGDTFLTADPFHCFYFSRQRSRQNVYIMNILLPCKKNWLGQGFVPTPPPPPLPPSQTSYCAGPGNMNSNCGFVSVRGWRRDHIL